MSPRTLTTIIAAAFLLVAVEPAAAQERGTIEFGAFGSYSGFDDALRMDNGFGGGVRIGAFIFPRLSAEFDLGRKQADRPDGLPSVDVETFAWRLTAVPFVFGPVSTLVGAGLSHTDIQNDVDESEGFQGLLGAKVRLGSSSALRVEGVMDWNDDGIRNQALQVGLSLYRHPEKAEPARAPRAEPQRPDSVSAAETRRLREIERRYRALRDSLARGWTLSAAERATLIERIHFQHDRSALSDTARSILRAKVPVFEANPDLRIVLTGYASEPATEDYNLALGLRRAEAARDYLVSQGIPRSRIDIATRGEGDQLAVQGPTEVVEAANRRAEFRILIAER